MAEGLQNDSRSVDPSKITRVIFLLTDGAPNRGSSEEQCKDHIACVFLCLNYDTLCLVVFRLRKFVLELMRLQDHH